MPLSAIATTSFQNEMGHPGRRERNERVRGIMEQTGQASLLPELSVTFVKRTLPFVTVFCFSVLAMYMGKK